MIFESLNLVMKHLLYLIVFCLIIFTSWPEWGLIVVGGTCILNILVLYESMQPTALFGSRMKSEIYKGVWRGCLLVTRTVWKNRVLYYEQRTFILSKLYPSKFNLISEDEIKSFLGEASERLGVRWDKSRDHNFRDQLSNSLLQPLTLARENEGKGYSSHCLTELLR